MLQLPKTALVLGAYLSDSNQTMTVSMPAYPLFYTNTSFVLERVPFYVLSKAETANSCEIKDFPSQWPFVVFIHDETSCGNFDKMLELCDRKSCLGVIYSPFDSPSMAGWGAHVGGGSKSITSHTPVMLMEAYPGPEVEWLLREGARYPGAVLISVRSDEYNEGAEVLSSWKLRCIGIIIVLHVLANIVAVLWKLWMKILDLRDGKMQRKPHSPLPHTTRRRFGLPMINVWHPLFVLFPELIAGVVVVAFWINISFFRAQRMAWNLFRVSLTAAFPFAFISSFTTAFIFSRITLKNIFSKQRSWAHKLAGSLFLRMTSWAVVLVDVSLTIHTAITDVEIFPATFISGFYTIMQFFGSIYFIVGGRNMVKLLSKGGSSSKSSRAQTLQFANRVWFSGIAMLGFSASLIMVAVAVIAFPSATLFWYSYALTTYVGAWVSSSQIRAIVVKRRLAKPRVHPLPPN